MQLSKAKIRQIEHIAGIFKLEPDRLMDALIKIGFDLPKNENQSAPVRILSPEQKVKAIEEEALDKGWIYEQLWANAKWHDKRGLVHYINDKTRIAEITEKHIALIHERPVGGPVIRNFYNMNVEQPWISRIKSTKNTRKMNPNL